MFLEFAENKAKALIFTALAAAIAAVVAFSGRVSLMLGPEWSVIVMVGLVALPLSLAFMRWVKRDALREALAKWAEGNLRVGLRNVSVILGDRPKIRAIVGVERVGAVSPGVSFQRASVSLFFPTIGFSTKRVAVTDPKMIQTGDLVGVEIEWEIPKEEAVRLSSQSSAPGWRHYVQIEECQVDSNIAKMLSFDGMFPYRIEV